MSAGLVEKCGNIQQPEPAAPPTFSARNGECARDKLIANRLLGLADDDAELFDRNQEWVAISQEGKN